MAKFIIPEPFQGGFEVLAHLTDEKLQRVTSILNKLQVGTGPKAFQSAIVTGVEVERATLLARTLFSLGRFLVAQEIPIQIEGLAKEIADSYNETRTEKLSEENFERLVNNLLTVLNSCGNLKDTFKALNLLAENDKIFRSARIMTDIRLVFNDQITDSERNAVIIHQLKIEYQNNNVAKEFYVSMDSADLKKLLEQVERAINKEDAIKDNYKGAISFINVIE